MAATCEYRANIEAAVTRTPRFLFRFWHEASGGDSRLNTIDAITPLAFLAADASYYPHSFFNIPKRELSNLARRHVGADKSFQTVFSSWSQSLGFVLSWARLFESYYDVSSFHISILDTSRLPPSNVAIHASFLKQHIDPLIPDYHIEYLIFGTVSGTMYESRPLSSFPEYMTKHFTTDIERWQSFISRNETHPFHDSSSEQITTQEIEAAIAVGNLYGSHFAMPFAAHLLGLRCNNLPPSGMRHVVSRLASMDMPPAWATDDTILSLDDIFTNSFWESRVAALLIKKAVERKYASNQQATSSSSREARNLHMDSKFGEDIETNPRRGTRNNGNR